MKKRGKLITKALVIAFVIIVILSLSLPIFPF